MKKEIAELWCKALRSGEFKQGRYALYKDADNTYCVVGVLCMLAMVEGVCDYSVKAGNGYFDYNATNLPKSVQDWAGMKTKGTVPGEFLSLSGLNDLAEWDFLQLADFVESNYEQL